MNTEQETSLQQDQKLVVQALDELSLQAPLTVENNNRVETIANHIKALVIMSVNLKEETIDLKSKVKNLENEREELEEKVYDLKSELQDYENTTDHTLEMEMKIDEGITSDNLLDLQKVGVCKRLMKNLTLERMELLENIAKAQTANYIVD